VTFASVRAAAQHIAKVGEITPHQLAALTRLDERLTDPQRQEFTELWRAEGSPAAHPPADWMSPSLAIIREFEGLRLDAYQDAVGIWTVGYGTTRLIDRPVRQGDRITQKEAEALLQNDVQIRYRQLAELLPMVRQWSANRVAALVSWAYNVGMGAVMDSTLRQRLMAGEDPVRVISEELPRWNRGDGKVLAGLTRRRKAEVDLFMGAPKLEIPAQQEQSARVTPSSPFSTLLTAHIRLGEFALDQEARRFHHQHQVDTAAELAAFLERVRRNFGNKPVIITSGYRPPEVNRAVGGASRSEHLYDAPDVGAVDFFIEGADINQVQAFCDKFWPHSVGYGAAKGFVHLGLRRGRPRVRWDY
jgi:GH24 family phage-related lysozyme (muramidase)